MRTAHLLSGKASRLGFPFALAVTLCVTAACQKKPRRPQYEVVEKPNAESTSRAAKKERPAPGRPRPDTPRPRALHHLTEAPKLTVLSPGAEPRARFAVGIGSGFRALYDAKVSQVTSAPEPIGSFESSFEFQLTESAARDKTADKTAGAHTKGKKARSPRHRPTGQADSGNATGSVNDTGLAGLPLRVSISDVRIRLPKRFHVDSQLLAKQLEGVSYLARLLPDGSLGDFQVEGHLPRDLTASLEQLGRSLNRLQPPTPNVPMGKGAHWRVTSEFKATGHLSLPHTDIQVTMVTDYHLLGFQQTPQGKAAKITTVISVRGKNHSTTVPIEAKGQGKGRLLLLVSPTLVLSHRSRTTIESKVQGKKSSNSTLMELTLRSLKLPKPQEPKTGRTGGRR